MFDHDSIYNVLDSHFTAHLVRGDENEPAPDGPESMLDDFIDELDETLEELHGQYGQAPKALNALVFGFADGAIAWSADSYSTYEDEYIEDAANPRHVQLDAKIAAYTKDYEGNRDWGEAAMGYMRRIAASLQEAQVEDVDELLLAQAIGFARGADAAEDYEWKIVQDSAGNIIITDEETLDEFTFNQMNASGTGLFDRISNALGIDLGGLKSALADIADDEEDEENED